MNTLLLVWSVAGAALLLLILLAMSIRRIGPTEVAWRRMVLAAEIVR
jgi:hypothetical protein